MLLRGLLAGACYFWIVASVSACNFLDALWLMSDSLVFHSLVWVHGDRRFFWFSLRSPCFSSPPSDYLDDFRLRLAEKTDDEPYRYDNQGPYDENQIDSYGC